MMFIDLQRHALEGHIFDLIHLSTSSLIPCSILCQVVREKSVGMALISLPSIYSSCSVLLSVFPLNIGVALDQRLVHHTNSDWPIASQVSAVKANLVHFPISCFLLVHWSTFFMRVVMCVLVKL